MVPWFPAISFIPKIDRELWNKLYANRFNNVETIASAPDEDTEILFVKNSVPEFVWFCNILAFVVAFINVAPLSVIMRTKIN